MFERYTELARRVIFFARYEASHYGSPFIEPEHILLGLTREDVSAISRTSFVDDALKNSIRRAVENGIVVKGKASSVDLPLSRSSKRVLAYAAEESERYKHEYIDTVHLCIGLLDEPGTLAERVLYGHGINREGLGKHAFDPEFHIREVASQGGKSLDLSNLYLSRLPDSVLALRNLTSLILARNALQSLPDDFGVLERLEYLDLRSNPLTQLPWSIRRLTALRVLLLEGNTGLRIPQEVLYTKPPDDTILRRRYFGDDKLPEINPRRPEAILDFYFRTAVDARPLNEMKLILVGRGAVGKTSIVQSLVRGSFDPSEKKTDGIQITKWPVALNNGEEVRFSIWDFGGQEIMHSTHQFFLSHRSIYLVVLNGRGGLEDVDAEYWLRLISSFGGESPVIVVLNKIHEYPFDVNRRALQAKFPAIRHFVPTDCANRSGIAELREAIKRETGGLTDLRDVFPASWFHIKQRLEELRKNYLTFEDYRQICRELNESDVSAQDRLADYLHSLGVALNYRDDPRLQDTHVLNPHWVTNGIYSIINSEILERQKGEITLAQSGEILTGPEYPPRMRRFIFDLMKRFELCFSFPNDECSYLVPDLLDKQEPGEAMQFDPKECLSFQYRYPILPEGLLPRFIVRSQALSHGLPRWRTGVMLSFESNRALVKADVQDRQVLIHVSGPRGGRRRLLAVIRSDFERIHADIRNLHPQELVPIPGDPGVQISYTDLLLWETAGRKHYSIAIEGQILDIGVQALLNGVDLSETRARKSGGAEQQRAPISLFISYSHKDDSFRKELDTHIKLLQRQGAIDVWTDVLIDPGESWSGAIQQSLETADLIILLISSDFLASDYCYNIEMQRALERHQEGTTVLIPVIVRDVNWQRSPIANIQALPAGGQAVTTWSNRDSAWSDVARGIEIAASKVAARRTEM